MRERHERVSPIKGVHRRVGQLTDALQGHTSGKLAPTMRLSKTEAVHVTFNLTSEVWNLRSARCFRVIEDSLADARERFELRVIEFCVMGHRLHLFVEADCNLALWRGMQALRVRIARRLNRLMGRRGPVFADRYCARVLESPSEFVDAIAYVLGNAAHHYGRESADAFSSSAYDGEKRERVLSRPRTWLLIAGWRRARQVVPPLQDDVPVSAAA
jgi:putative transposase